MEKKKLTTAEIEANMKKLDEAIGFAKLDNKASISPFAQELFDKMVRGELTPEEVENQLIAHYKKEF